MATPNYGYAKRQRELEKKRKKEEKARAKAQGRSGAQQGGADEIEGVPNDGAPDAEAHPIILGNVWPELRKLLR